MNRLVSFIFFVTLTSLAFSLSADGDDYEKIKSEAIGYYNKKGELRNGENILSQSGYIHKIFLDRKRHYGTEELVDFVINLSREVSSWYVDVEKLQIGDLSNIEGGHAPGHKSHQNGLDVDIVYLTHSGKLQEKENKTWTQYFVYKKKVLKDFYTKRNWDLFKYIVKESDARRIFVDPAIKKKLCKYASKIGEKRKYEEVLRRIKGAKYHKTHFHVRLKCPRSDKQCVNQALPSKGSGC